MRIDRRSTLRLLGSTLAAPFVLRPDDAQAAVVIENLGNPVELGATQPGGKTNVALSAFDNAQGGFIAAWTNYRSSTDVRAFVRKFGNNGAPLSPAIQMGGAGGPTDGIPAIDVAPVALPNGSSLIVFTAARHGVTTVDSYDVFAQPMSANFQKVGNPIVVNKTLAGAQAGVLATRLTTGKVQVVWESFAGDFSSSIIRGRVINANGVPVKPERTVITHTTGFNSPRGLAPRPNGGAVLSYTRVASAGALPADGPAEDVSVDWFQEVIDLLKGDPTKVHSSPATTPFGSAGVDTFLDEIHGTYGSKHNNLVRLNLASYNDGSPIVRPIGTFKISPAQNQSPGLIIIQLPGIPDPAAAVSFVETGPGSTKDLKLILANIINGAMYVNVHTIVSSNNTFLVGGGGAKLSNKTLAFGYQTGNDALSDKAFFRRNRCTVK